MNEGWFWGLGAMIGETMMKFSGTMRVSSIGRFLQNLPKIHKTQSFDQFICDRFQVSITPAKAAGNIFITRQKNE